MRCAASLTTEKGLAGSHDPDFKSAGQLSSILLICDDKGTRDCAIDRPALDLQEGGLDTVDANRALGFPDDCREYTSVHNILRDLGVKSVRLMVRTIQLAVTVWVALGQVTQLKYPSCPCATASSSTLGFHALAFCLQTNNPRKVNVLMALGVNVTGRLPCIVKAQEFNEGYMATKAARMDHELTGVEVGDFCYWNHVRSVCYPLFCTT